MNRWNLSARLSSFPLSSLLPSPHSRIFSSSSFAVAGVVVLPG
jgi:hypothetical protein